jgi:hypothetical protein
VRDRRTNWRDDDAGFKAWARLGFDWQKPVLDVLLKAGLPATMPALELRKDVTEARAFRNQADERAHYAHGVAELAMKHRDVAESALAQSPSRADREPDCEHCAQIADARRLPWFWK